MRIRRSGVLLAAVVLAAGLAARPAAQAAPPGPGESVPAFGHVFLIIGENTTYSHLTAGNAPYLLGTLRPRAAWLANYHAATHWSQANYVALVTGQFTRCEQQDGGIACHQNVDNLFHQLDLAGLTWKVLAVCGPRPPRRRNAWPTTSRPGLPTRACQHSTPGSRPATWPAST